MLRCVTRSVVLFILPSGFPLAVLATLALLLPGLRLPASGHADESVSFIRGTLSGAGVTFERPTALTFGPHGRLYVAEQEGRIRALTLDPVSKEITAVEQVASSGDLQEVFGIAFRPTDTSSPPPVYVTNTVSGWGDDGPAPAGSFPGKVTKIDGAGYANKTDIITGLPVSNFAHQSNGLVFADDGTLYVAQGSTTNAGVPRAPFSQAEVPLSSALLVANPSAPGFDGNITYDPPDTYDTSVDQISGDVSVYASGLRNPYDLIIHSNGRIYLTDNGPHSGGGPASNGCDSQTTDPQGPDELNIIEEGDYYGHPNRNRGRFDPRQCVYHSGTEGSGPDWTGPIQLLPTSSNGLVEYTVNSFGGKLKGNLFYVGYVNGVVGRIVLSPDGSSVVSHTQLDSGFVSPLDVTMGADGTLYVAEYGSGDIVTLQPPAPGGPLGDVDCDGVVNSIDAALVLQLVAGLIGSLPCPDAADVNEDGLINSIDAALILQYVAGLIPSLPPP